MLAPELIRMEYNIRLEQHAAHLLAVVRRRASLQQIAIASRQPSALSPQPEETGTTLIANHQATIQVRG
jgi:hypothetical protein